MKKIILILMAVVLSVSVSYAAPSAGLNFSYDYLNSSSKADPVETWVSFNNLNGGLFFDLKYLLVNVDYLHSVGKYTTKVEISGVSASADTAGSRSDLGMNLLGKFPIKVNDKISFFPLLGVEYVINLTMEDKDGNDLKKGLSDEQKSDMNDIYLKGGLGLDFNLTERVYLRLTGLYGYNVTAEPKTPVSGMTYFGYSVAGNLSVGCKF